MLAGEVPLVLVGVDGADVLLHVVGGDESAAVLTHLLPLPPLAPTLVHCHTKSNIIPKE